MYIVHLVLFWLNFHSPQILKRVILTYPVRGHSFLPNDRVFGRIEKVLKKHSVILTPDKYIELYSRFGEVKVLGKDWSLLDVKSLSQELKKVDGISQMKRIVIEKSMVKGKPKVSVECLKYYRNNDCDRFIRPTLMKRGKILERTMPELPLFCSVSKEKKQDIRKLFDKFGGENWEENEAFKWYNDNLFMHPEDNLLLQEEDISEEDELCLRQEDDSGLKL